MRFKEYSPSKYHDIEMQNVPILHDSSQQQQSPSSSFDSSSTAATNTMTMSRAEARRVDSGAQTVPLFVIEEDDLSPRLRKV
jgi:hypothetical protein